ncbi:MAG: RecX family transcriptional regulator [Cryomorphaceae bacterium]|nr:RecX family transcriptional regulator [Cryomorphaceae bacterium]
MKRVDQEDKKPLDFNAKLEALRYFCAYRERTQKEVKEKAMGLELSDDEWQRAIAELQEGGYQDDERFAAAYVSGHFRIKGWGRNKIRHGLKFSGLTETTIRAAIEKNIDDAEYLQKLTEVLRSKGSERIKSAKERDKLIRFALQRGYEYEAIRHCLNQDV